MASHGQQHAQRLFGYSDSICPGRIHHCDPLARGRIQVDIVHTHACPANYAKLFRMRQQLRVRLHRRAHYQRVSGFQVL